MRLSVRLLAQHRVPWFKNIWKKKSRNRAVPARIPQCLLDAGVKPKAATEVFFAKPESQVWVPPKDPRFMFPPREEDHPHWHDKKAFTFNNQTRLYEGTKQAQLLTNSLVINGLPNVVADRVNTITLPNQDHMAQRIILESFLWDSTSEKLPKRKKPDDISVWHYKTEYGIPRSRSILMMINSLVDKCMQAAALRDPSQAFNKRVVNNIVLNSSIKFGDESIYLTSESDILLASKEPLRPFAESSELEETRGQVIQDMFPMSPTVDLVHSNIYIKESSLGYADYFPHSNHHTMFLSVDKEWPMEQRHASALLHAYTHCTTLARRKKIEKLEQSPVSMQVIHTDGESFGFVCFQLNTLDSVQDDSVHNLAWIDHDSLFELSLPRRSMLRNTHYKNYNDKVMKKLLSMISL